MWKKTKNINIKVIWNSKDNENWKIIYKYEILWTIPHLSLYWFIELKYLFHERHNSNNNIQIFSKF